MNRWRESLQSYVGSVPQPFAVYQAPFVGALAMPFMLGICSYQVPDLASVRTVEELATAITGMEGRLTEINNENGIQPLGDEQRAEWEALEEAITAFKGAKGEAEARRDRVAQIGKAEANREAPRSYGAPQVVRSRLPENLHDLTEYRTRTGGSPAAMAALMGDGVRKLAETISFPHPGTNRDKAVANIQRLVAQSGDDPHFAHRFLATSSPDFLRATAKRIAGQYDLLTSSERAAIATVGTTTAGGYAVPDILDPTIVLTSDGAVNPIRSMARVETITGAGNKFQAVTSQGITLSYGPTEGSAITETTSPVLAQPEVTVQPVKGEIRYSIESVEDWPRLLSELSMLIQDARDTLEANAFINGDGSGEPEGVIYGLASASAVGTTGDGLDAEDIYRLVNRLGPRFRSKGQFLANQLVYDTIAQFVVGDTSEQRMFIRGTGGNPGSLLSWTAREASEMEDDTTQDGNKVLLFGDFKTGYLIVDKVGLSVQDAGFVRDGNGALTGQRALFIHYRNSAVVAVDNAFRLLKIGVVTTGV